MVMVYNKSSVWPIPTVHALPGNRSEAVRILAVGGLTKEGRDVLHWKNEKLLALSAGSRRENTRDALSRQRHCRQ